MAFDFNSEEFQSFLSRLEKANSLPTGLLSSLARTESGGNPKAVSKVGAKGLFQFTDATAKDFNLKDPFDPVQSAKAAAKKLSNDITKTGSVDLGIAAYNAGLGAVQKHGGIPPFEETQNFVSKVKSGLNMENEELFDPFAQAQTKQKTGSKQKQELFDPFAEPRTATAPGTDVGQPSLPAQEAQLQAAPTEQPPSLSEILLSPRFNPIRAGAFQALGGPLQTLLEQVAPEMGKYITQNIARELETFRSGVEQLPPAAQTLAGAGEFVGEVGPSLAIPGAGGVGALGNLRGILTNALVAGGLAGTQFQEPGQEESRFEAGLRGGGISAILDTALRGGGAYVRSTRASKAFNQLTDTIESVKTGKQKITGVEAPQTVINQLTDDVKKQLGVGADDALVLSKDISKGFLKSYLKVKRTGNQLFDDFISKGDEFLDFAINNPNAAKVKVPKDFKSKRSANLINQIRRERGIPINRTVSAIDDTIDKINKSANPDQDLIKFWRDQRARLLETTGTPTDITRRTVSRGATESAREGTSAAQRTTTPISPVGEPRTRASAGVTSGTTKSTREGVSERVLVPGEERALFERNTRNLLDFMRNLNDEIKTFFSERGREAVPSAGITNVAPIKKALQADLEEFSNLFGGRTDFLKAQKFWETKVSPFINRELPRQIAETASNKGAIARQILDKADEIDAEFLVKTMKKSTRKKLRDFTVVELVERSRSEGAINGAKLAENIDANAKVLKPLFGEDFKLLNGVARFFETVATAESRPQIEQMLADATGVNALLQTAGIRLFSRLDPLQPGTPRTVKVLEKLTPQLSLVIDKAFQRFQKMKAQETPEEQ
jgi:hypothetical protein